MALPWRHRQWLMIPPWRYCRIVTATGSFPAPANRDTGGVVGRSAVQPLSSEFRSGMTPFTSPGDDAAGMASVDRLPRAGREAVQRRRSQSPSRRPIKPSNLSPDGRTAALNSSLATRLPDSHARSRRSEPRC